jgi:hypothetical protein
VTHLGEFADWVGSHLLSWTEAQQPPPVQSVGATAEFQNHGDVEPRQVILRVAGTDGCNYELIVRKV